MNDHRQNAITWFTLACLGSLLSVFIGGLTAVAALAVGLLSLVFGGIELHRHRKAKKHRPKLKTQAKRQVRKTAKTVKTKGNETWNGKEHRASKEYRKRPASKTPKPETTPGGKCSVRCRRSSKPAETCECVCGGKQHGSAA